MKTKTKVAIAVLSLAVVGSGIGFGINQYIEHQDEIKLGLVDRIYHSLPVEVQEEYLTGLFLLEDYDYQSKIVKGFVDHGMLTMEDNAYVGSQALMQLPTAERTATLELVLDNSNYVVQKEVTMYGIGMLEPGDAGEAIVNSGKNLWNNFTEKVEEAYKQIFER